MGRKQNRTGECCSGFALKLYCASRTLSASSSFEGCHYFWFFPQKTSSNNPKKPYTNTFCSKRRLMMNSCLKHLFNFGLPAHAGQCLVHLVSACVEAPLQCFQTILCLPEPVTRKGLDRSRQGLSNSNISGFKPLIV